MRIPAVGNLSNSFGWVGVDKERERTSNSADIKSNTGCGWVEGPAIWISAGNAFEINSLKTLALGAGAEANLADESVVNSSKVASRAKRQGEFNTKLAAKAATSNFRLSTTTLPRAACLVVRTLLQGTKKIPQSQSIRIMIKSRSVGNGRSWLLGYVPSGLNEWIISTLMLLPSVFLQ